MNLASIFNLFAQPEPPFSVMDILTVPVVIWMFGMAFWFFAVMGRRQGKAQRWKWFLAYGLAILAVWCAWSGKGADNDCAGFGAYCDAGCRSVYAAEGKRLIVAVWASFLIPVLSLPLMWFFDWRESKHLKELIS